MDNLEKEINSLGEIVKKQNAEVDNVLASDDVKGISKKLAAIKQGHEKQMEKKIGSIIKAMQHDVKDKDEFMKRFRDITTKILSPQYEMLGKINGVNHSFGTGSAKSIDFKKFEKLGKSMASSFTSYNFVVTPDELEKVYLHKMKTSFTNGTKKTKNFYQDLSEKAAKQVQAVKKSKIKAEEVKKMADKALKNNTWSNRFSSYMDDLGDKLKDKTTRSIISIRNSAYKAPGAIKDSVKDSVKGSGEATAKYSKAVAEKLTESAKKDYETASELIEKHGEKAKELFKSSSKEIEIVALDEPKVNAFKEFFSVNKKMIAISSAAIGAVGAAAAVALKYTKDGIGDTSDDIASRYEQDK